MGPTPGTTPKTMQPMPASESPGRGISGDPEDQDIMRGHYTCYRQPCTNCADPFPSHRVPECKEPTSVNIGLRFLWHSVTHQGIQLLAQAHRWNNQLTEDDEPCDVCGKRLEEHDLRACILRARVRSNVWGRFNVQLSNPKEILDWCPVEPWSHGHETLEELRSCFFNKKMMFESSR